MEAMAVVAAAVAAVAVVAVVVAVAVERFGCCHGLLTFVRMRAHP